MKKVEILLTEEQFQNLTSQIQKGTELNFQEETFSGFSLKLSVIEGGIGYLDFEMISKFDLGEVAWTIK